MGEQPLGAAVGAYFVELRPDDSACAREFMAADAAGFLKHRVAARQLGRLGHVRREMTFGASGFNVFHWQHGMIPVYDLAVGRLASGGASLALMTDRAAKLVERVPVMVGMIGQRQRKPGIGRIFDRQVATRATVHAISL